MIYSMKLIEFASLLQVVVLVLVKLCFIEVESSGEVMEKLFDLEAKEA